MNLVDHASMETTEGEPVALLGARITGDLRGLLFEASVEQRFVNPEDEFLELVYRFPLPWGAVLLGIDVQLGEKRLAGVVVERAEAEASYEDALAEGDAAVMLEKNSDDSYCLSLGNLAPGEHCTITLRYAQLLQFEQGALRLLIPTVIAPRYEGGEHDSRLPAHQRTTPSLTAEHGLDLELALHGSLAQARVASPSHPISVTSPGECADAPLRVALARQAWLDRDFVLVLDQLTHTSLALAAQDYACSDQLTVLASFCPRFVGHAPQDVAAKILVDCSGSMNGDSIEAAKRALQAIVLQLRGHDRFSLSRFGSHVEHRSRNLWKVTDATRIAAQRWVGALEADLGGTEMQQALESTLQLAHGGRSDVLLVTDGGIGSVDAVIASAQDSGHRIFVVGVGSSAAESHLRKLARATGGACDFVAPGEAVEPAVLRMFARMRSVRLTALRVQWPGGAQPEWQITLPPAVFDGDTVNVFAGFRAMPGGEIFLKGQVEGDRRELELGRVSLAGGANDADTVSRLAAAVRIEAASRADAAASNGIDSLRLAVDYQLVTEQTNFLLVHERSAEDKAADMPQLRQIRPMLAAGWGGVGSVMSPPSSLRAPRSAMAPVSFLRSVSRASFGRLFDEDDNSSSTDVSTFRIDRTNPRYWSKCEHYTGLTPMGVAEWLRNHAEEQWPTNYSGLREMGLGQEIIEWLELAIGLQEDGSFIEESNIVKKFLALMSCEATLGALQTGSSLPHAAEAEEGLYGKLLMGLRSMTSEEWPVPVWDMTTANSD